MASREYRLRIRPQRIVVILPAAGLDEWQLAVKLLSNIWGGRHAQVLALDEQDEPTLQSQLRWLRRSRPEVVVSIGLPPEWKATADEICQPCLFIAIPEVENGYETLRKVNPAGLIFYDSRFEVLAGERLDLSRVTLWDLAIDLPFGAHVRAAFGAPADPPQHLESLGAELENLSQDTSLSGYVKACQALAGRLGWLDLVNSGLRVRLREGDAGFLPPTVVVGSTVADLALFWNLRSNLGWGSSGRVISVPATIREDPAAQRAVRAWLASVPISASFGCLLSRSLTSVDLADLADNLKSENRSQILVNDARYVSPPILFAYEEELYRAVDQEDRFVEIPCPRPESVIVRTGQKWAVDLMADVRTGRKPGDLALPYRRSMVGVLRAPSPPEVPLRSIPTVGYGPLDVVLRVGHEPRTVRFCLPTSEELLFELLRERGAWPRFDDKRAAYEEALELFGDIATAGCALRGLFCATLQALFDSTEPLPLKDLMGKARLGKLRKKSRLPERIREFLGTQDAGPRRIARRRYKAYYANRIYSGDMTRETLEHWTSTGIVLLDGDGRYFMAPALRRALDQGLAPVVLTGCLLRGLTTSGFHWLPGVKVKKDGKEQDIDILAICDGNVFFIECKDLHATPSTARGWDEALEQLKSLVELGRDCGAQVVGLATRAPLSNVPKRVTDFIAGAGTNQMSVILFDGDELERGSLAKDRGRPEFGIDRLLPGPPLGDDRNK